MRMSKERAQARLDEIASWEEGWDGWDGTEPIPPKAIEAAQKLLDLFPDQISSISPDDGGVIVRFGGFPYTVQIATDGDGQYDHTLVEVIMDVGPDIPLEQVKDAIEYALDPKHRLRTFELANWKINE